MGWEVLYTALRAALELHDEFTVVDDSHADVYLKETAKHFFTPLSKYDAIVGPAVGDDSDDDYGIGSHWYDVTADKAYICLDASVGAAVWKEVGGGGGGETYVDRGDPSAFDWAVGNFTLDGTWRDLDLSSIVPAGAADKPVYLLVDIQDNVAATSVSFRTKGNTDVYNVLSMRVVIANQLHRMQGWVVCDASRFIQYYGSPGLVTLNVLVRGWMIGG